MFEDQAISLIIAAFNSGQDTSKLEAILAKQLGKNISNEEFYKIPLQILNRIVDSYDQEMSFEMAKELITNCSKVNGPETIVLLPHIKIGKIGSPAAITLMKCINGIPLINELEAGGQQNIDNKNPTKVFVDFPASANVQLVFRPPPNQ